MYAFKIYFISVHRVNVRRDGEGTHSDQCSNDSDVNLIQCHIIKLKHLICHRKSSNKLVISNGVSEDTKLLISY